MFRRYILIVLIIPFFSLGLLAQKGYPAPPENNSKEVMEKYQEAVDQWYRENPKSEEEVVSQPQETVKQEVIAGPNLTSDDIPKNAVVWKLSTVEVIENGKIDEKLNDFQQAFIDQFTANKLRIYIHNDQYLYAREGQGIVKKFVLETSDDKMSLKEDDCPKCKEKTVNVINYDSSSLITEKEYVDDKGNKFNVRFSYTVL